MSDSQFSIQSAHFSLPAGHSPFWTSVAAETGDIRASPGKFCDDLWPLVETLPEGEHGEPGSLRWVRFPVEARHTVKVLGWLLLNEGVPQSFVLDHGKATVANLTPVSNAKCVRHWAQLYDWLGKRGIWDISLVTNDTWLAFADEKLIQAGATRSVSKMTLLSLSRLWILSERLELGVAKPPWYGSEDMAEFLPPDKRTAANSTAVIPIEVVSPLLTWAILFVDEFSADILAARKEVDDLRKWNQVRGTNSSHEPSASSLMDWYKSLMEAGHAIPSKPNGSIASVFIGARFGAGPEWVRDNTPDAVRQYAADRPGPCPLSTPIRGRLDGKPWLTVMDYYDLDKYWQLLGTAALICIGYLTGMRLNELLGLSVGCCQQVQGKTHWTISGVASRKTSKALLDETRESTWIAIGPAARAVAVLEQMVGTGLLFAAAKLEVTPSRAKGRERPMVGQTVTSRLRDFAAFVASAESDEIGTSAASAWSKLHYMQFRRTLAYYIARQPGGMVALAVQYNHMRWATSEGYASRRTDGFAALLDIETARAAADILGDLADELANGGVLSGPGSTRLQAAAEHYAQTYPGRILTRSEALRFFEVSEHRVYMNPDFFSYCHFDSLKALCRRNPRPDEADHPHLSECQSGCGNLAHTDEFMSRAAKKADFLEEKAIHEDVSPLIADRIRHNAGLLRALVGRHEAKRQAK